MKNLYLFIYLFIYLIIYLENDRYLKRGSLSNVHSMGDCDGSEHPWSFPVTAFHVISMVSLQDLQPL